MMDPYDGARKGYPRKKSLYEREQDVSGLEGRILDIIDGSDNILWWHRIVSRNRDEFSINGPINHFPDFVARTRTGVTVLIEAKGPQLHNPDSALKVRIGRDWASLAGREYRYMMVFENEADRMEGTFSADQLRDILENLKP